ncbi:MAG: MarR family winged helix-turn-helix transcriptional regulator [Acidimicrobiales bacterium]
MTRGGDDTPDDQSMRRLRRDPSQQLEFLLSEVTRLLQRVYNARFRTTGLNQSQVAALVNLDRIGGLTQTEVARRLGMGKAAVGALLEDLEQRSLVRRARHESDGRAIAVSITEEGRRMVGLIDELAKQLGSDLRTGVTPAERGLVIDVLKRLRSNLEHMAAAPPPE